jgi:hypothetical protein
VAAGVGVAARSRPDTGWPDGQGTGDRGLHVHCIIGWARGRNLSYYSNYEIFAKHHSYGPELTPLCPSPAFPLLLEFTPDSSGPERVWVSGGVHKTPRSAVDTP